MKIDVKVHHLAVVLIMCFIVALYIYINTTTEEEVVRVVDVYVKTDRQVSEQNARPPVPVGRKVTNTTLGEKAGANRDGSHIDRVNNITVTPGQPKNNLESAIKIYSFLKEVSKGSTNYPMSDKQIASILGVWFAECNLDATKVEGVYLNFGQLSFPFPSYLTFNTEASELSEHTKGLIEKYSEQGLSVHEPTYLIDNAEFLSLTGIPEGSYAPGIGLAQWTGDNAAALIYTAEMSSLSWTDLETQLAYLILTRRPVSGPGEYNFFTTTWKDVDSAALYEEGPVHPDVSRITNIGSYGLDISNLPTEIDPEILGYTSTFFRKYEHGGDAGPFAKIDVRATASMYYYDLIKTSGKFGIDENFNNEVLRRAEIMRANVLPQQRCRQPQQ